MTTVEEMKMALLSNGGLDSVRVTVVTLSSVFSDQEQSKIFSVNKFNNFQYVNRSIIVWRAYGVGKGKTVTIKSSRIQWNPDFLNLQGKHKLVREIGSSRNRWH